MNRIFYQLRWPGLALLVCFLLGCNGPEGAVAVDVGEVNSAHGYRVDLYADEPGLDLVEGAFLRNERQVVLKKVPAGRWALFIQALNGNSETLAHYQAKVFVKDGETIQINAGNYKPGMPGDRPNQSESNLSSFGPNGEALLSATHTAGSDADVEATIDLELSSGEGQAVEEPPARTLSRAEAGVGRQCGTSFLSESDWKEADGVRAQEVRYQISQVEPGQSLDFFVITTFRTISAQRLLTDAQTEHCLIFAEVLEGSAVITEEAALAIAEGFDRDNPFQEGDNGIYEDTRARFGSEWVVNGGRDGDERVVLLFLSSDSIGGKGLFGFFNPADQRSKETSNNSNEGEILYINADRAADNVYEALVTIAHEFSHLIIFNQKVGRNGEFPEGAVSENAVLDEGLAVLNEELSGFGYTGPQGGNYFLLSAVSKLLDEGLNRSYFQFGGTLADYGAGYLFWRFIHDQHGIEAIRAITTSPEVGRTNVQSVLEVPFSEFFRQYTLALALAGQEGLQPELQFTDLDLFEKYTATEGTEFDLQGLQGIRNASLPGTLNASLSIRAWGTEFYRASGGDGSPLSWRASGNAVITGVVPVANAE
ncbi:MAG: hypothetical protein WC314_23110 [Vulcanimicrobiota bacterium]